ncbi:MAG: hypothetical protein ABR923_16035 [Terracidiphilus sp.]
MSVFDGWEATRATGDQRWQTYATASINTFVQWPRIVLYPNQYIGFTAVIVWPKMSGGGWVQPGLFLPVDR